MKRLMMTCAFTLASFSAHGVTGESVMAELEGNGVSGTVVMTETASGVVHVVVSANGISAGAHGFHVHETGRCEPGDGYKSAGGHLALGTKHGAETEGGPHPGDFPNVHVGDDGILKVEFFTRGFNVGQNGAERLMDEDGAAVVLHSEPDDYSSQPSGAAGERIACGVLEPNP